MISRRLATTLSLCIGVAVGLAAVACASNPASDATGQCGSADPCACIAPPPGQVCKADGVACACSEVGDSGPADAGAPDAQAGPDLALFTGRWSPVAGDGQSNCNGADSGVPPNPSSVVTFTPDGVDTLTATSSGAPGCTLQLVVSGTTATLRQTSEACAQPGGSAVTFTRFDLVYVPAGGGVQGTQTSDSSDAGAVVADGASTDVDAAAGDSSSDDGAASEDVDATADDGGGGEKGPPLEDAGVAFPDGDSGADAGPSFADAGAAAPGPRLDWTLADTAPTCATSLHYTLARAE